MITVAQVRSERAEKATHNAICIYHRLVVDSDFKGSESNIRRLARQRKGVTQKALTIKGKCLKTKTFV